MRHGNNSAWVRAAVCLGILLVGVGVFTWLTAGSAATAQAQEFQDPGAGGGAAAAPAGGGAAAPAAGGDTSGDAASSKKGRSRLAWTYQALGLGFSIIFLALSFTLVALFVMNLLTARRDNVVPLQLGRGV